MSVAEATQLGSTVFAAVAALGSGGAAVVMYRQWAASNTPAVTVDLALWQPKNVLTLTLVNYGAPVKKVSIVVVEGAEACMSFLTPHGFLGANERVQLMLGLTPTDDTKMTAIAYGFDLRGNNVYAWAANGQEGRWTARSRGLFRRRPTDLTAAGILQQFYPDAPDPLTLEKRPVTRMENTLSTPRWTA